MCGDEKRPCPFLFALSPVFTRCADQEYAPPWNGIEVGHPILFKDSSPGDLHKVTLDRI